MKQQVFVSVPASSGNIGPGFDVLGLALNFRNELRVRVLNRRPAPPVIHVVGEGENSLSRDSSNVVYGAIKTVYRKTGRLVPALELVCVNRIPLARGLGSSSAAILSGLLAANRLLGNPLSQDEILRVATKGEGHPDNVGPALLGGVRASVVLGDRVVSVELPTPVARVVVAIPDFQLSTKVARKILPHRVLFKDAVFNLSAVALLPHALSHENSLLRDILNDRLHEPHRAGLIPGFFSVKQAALKAGAHGVILSGAGPTMLAFVPRDRLAVVSKAMKGAFRKAGVSCETKNLEIDRKGALVR